MKFAKNSTHCYMKSAKASLGNGNILIYYSSCSFLFLYVQILAFMYVCDPIYVDKMKGIVEEII